ncbi:MAG: ADP-ribosylation factor-like protein [Candidatus Hodarchaeales archaeon]|jgi:GTPase SAR1 family protein
MASELGMRIPSKILLMGSAQAGKTSIKEVVFGGLDPKTLKTKPTIQFEATLKEVIHTPFALWDAGGQKTYMEQFFGPMSKTMFSNVSALVWVVDVAAEDGWSRSKFYLDMALDNLKKHSPLARSFCFFHKIDLRPDYQEDGSKVEDLLTFFRNETFPDTRFHTTSLFDKSIYMAIADVLSNAVLDESTPLKDHLDHFVDEDISGVSIFTEEGLPLFQEGDLQNIVLVSANLWLAASDRIVGELDSSDKLSEQLVISDKFVLVFKHLEKSLLLAAVAKKTAPLQYVVVRTKGLAKELNKALLSEKGIGDISSE